MMWPPASHGWTPSTQWFFVARKWMKVVAGGPKCHPPISGNIWIFSCLCMQGFGSCVCVPCMDYQAWSCTRRFKIIWGVPLSNLPVSISVPLVRSLVMSLFVVWGGTVRSWFRMQCVSLKLTPKWSCDTNKLNTKPRNVKKRSQKKEFSVTSNPKSSTKVTGDGQLINL